MEGKGGGVNEIISQLAHVRDPFGPVMRHIVYPARSKPVKTKKEWAARRFDISRRERAATAITRERAIYRAMHQVCRHTLRYEFQFESALHIALRLAGFVVERQVKIDRQVSFGRVCLDWKDGVADLVCDYVPGGGCRDRTVIELKFDTQPRPEHLLQAKRYCDLLQRADGILLFPDVWTYACGTVFFYNEKRKFRPGCGWSPYTIA